MPDWFLGLLGCCVLLALPAAIIVLVWRLRSRVATLESTVREQAVRLAALEATPTGRAAETVTPPAVKTVTPLAVETPIEPSAPRIDVPASVAAASPAVPEAITGDAAATLEPPREPTPIATDEPKLDTSEPERAPEPRGEEERGWQGLEEALWTRLPVWIGAAALALAGAYLVKLSFDRGWIGPPVRVGLGFAFGGAMLALGEWLRRSSAYVAQGLSAAGIATLYVASYAAVELYDLVPIAIGFVLMVAITAAAVGLSLRQGYVVAAVGLVGGFLTPSLLRDDAPSTALLFAYLLLLQVGLLVVVRRRHWHSLGLVTAAAGFFWVFSVLHSGLDADGTIWVGLFLVASATTFLAAWVLGADASRGDIRMGSSLVGWATTGGGLLASGVLASQMDHGPLEWLFVALLAAGCLIAARLDERHADRLHGLAWLAAVLVTVFLFEWFGDVGLGDARRVFLTLAGFGVLLGGGAYAAHFGSRRPGRWATLTSMVAALYVLAAFFVAPHVGIDDFPAGGLALAIALMLGIMAWPVHRRRPADPDASRPLAALAAGATTLVSSAVPLELERDWLTVAWAIEIPILAWLALRLDVRALRVMAALLGVVVGARLVLNPMVLEYPIGSTPIWNALLWLYGVPIVAVVGAAVIDVRRGLGRFGEGLRLLAVALTTVFLALEVLHLAHGGQLDSPEMGLSAWGGWVIVWLALVWGVGLIADRLDERGVALDRGCRGVLLLALGTAIVGPGLAANPLWMDEPVGTIPIWNTLLWVYGLPIPLLLLVAAARREIGTGLDRQLSRVAQIFALGAVFWLVTLQVRQVFHGDLLHVGEVSTAEQTSYSIAWILLGSLLAVGGVAYGGRLLRFGSLAVLLPAVVKVFLVDTSGLDGLWRVASLVGLGVSLFALAWIYQRYVFRRS
ncbi:MAG: DUF2339 domain-containing protein [Acidobacteriota bacterium]